MVSRGVLCPIKTDLGIGVADWVNFQEASKKLDEFQCVDVKIVVETGLKHSWLKVKHIWLTGFYMTAARFAWPQPTATDSLWCCGERFETYGFETHVGDKGNGSGGDRQV